MRQEECAICGTLWQLWLPLASWLAARNLSSLRFDTEMLTRLVRRFLRMVPCDPSNESMACQTLFLSAVGSAGSSHLVRNGRFGSQRHRCAQAANMASEAVSGKLNVVEQHLGQQIVLLAAGC